MKNEYNYICLRVDSTDDKKNSGSGILLHSENNYYVVTAFHCIGDKETQSLYKDIEVWTNINEEKIRFSFVESNIKYFAKDRDVDLAIIVLNQEVEVDGFKKNINELEDFKNKLIIATNINDSQELKLIGFPEKKRDSGKISLEMDSISTRDYSFTEGTIRIKNIDYNYDGDLTLDDAIGGYSGSGMFAEINDSILLTGIFTEYKSEKGYGDQINVKTLIELLKNFNLKIPLTMNGEFSYNLEKKIEELSKDLTENYKELLGLNKSFQDLISFFKNEKNINQLERYLIKEGRKEIIEDELERTLIFLSILKMLNLNFEVNNHYIKSDEKNNIIFKSKNDKYYRAIISELYEYLNSIENRELKCKEIVYIADIVGIEGSHFNCCKCDDMRPMEGTNKLYNFFRKRKKLIPEKSENFLTLEIQNKNTVFKCGECFIRGSYNKGLNKMKGGK